MVVILFRVMLETEIMDGLNKFISDAERVVGVKVCFTIVRCHDSAKSEVQGVCVESGRSLLRQVVGDGFDELIVESW